MLAVALAGACGKSRPAQPSVPAAELIELMKGFADRGCGCHADKECVRPIRVEYDEMKRDLLANGKLLTGEDRAAFEAQHIRFGQCGDAAGLTIWDN